VVVVTKPLDRLASPG